MSSIFASTLNTRCLVEGSPRYIRSDVPVALTSGEIAWLREAGVVTAVDLRTPEEAAERPCSLAGLPGFDYISLPVTGGNAVPAAPDLVHISYLAMVDGRMKEIISAIENAKSNVIYFCSAGKDRTGVVSALLLTDIGAARQTIVDDYLLSADNLHDALIRYNDINPQFRLDIITPRASFIERFLDEVVWP